MVASRKTIVKLSLSILVAAGLGGLGQAAARGMVFYLVSHGGPGDPFWNPVIKGAQLAAEQLGVTLHYESPQVQGNVAGVIRLLNSAIAARPAGIGVTVDNTRGFEAPLQEAQRLGIPVVAFNTTPNTVNLKLTPFLSYVGQNNYTAGEGVAQAALAAFKLHSGDLVGIVNHQAGNTSLTSRIDGMRKVLGAAGVLVKVLTTPGSNPTQSEAILQSFLAKYPNTKALLTVGPLGYQPAAIVLKRNHMIGKVGLSGMDLNTAGLKLIQSGAMAFTWDQQPFVQGYMTVVELYLKAKYGFNPPSFYNTGVGLIDHSNVGNWISLVKRGDD